MTSFDRSAGAVVFPISASVRIDIEVESAETLYAAAFDRYEKANGRRHGEDLRGEFEDIYGTTDRADVPNLTRLLFDSGEDMVGISVRGSYASSATCSRRSSLPPCRANG